MQPPEQVRNHTQEARAQKELVPPGFAFLKLQRIEQMPKEKEAEYKAEAAQGVLVSSNTAILTHPPFAEKSAPLRIVSDKENGNRKHNISASFEESLYRLLRIRFRQEDKGYHRVPQYLNPSLERHERMVGPGDGKEAVDEKDREPAVILQDLPQADLPLPKDIKTYCNHGKIETGIHWTPFVLRAAADADTKHVQPYGDRSRPNDHHPNNWNPQRAGYVRLFANIPPKQEENKRKGQEGSQVGRHCTKRFREVLLESNLQFDRNRQMEFKRLGLTADSQFSRIDSPVEMRPIARQDRFRGFHAG